MDIVEELRQDREKGAKRLESEYKAGLMTLARRFCASESDAEELVNRTFAAVVEGIDDYLEQSAFFGWMCQILKNLHAIDTRRKSNSNEVYPGDVPDVADDDAQEAIYRSLDRSLVRAALEKLEADDREVLLLHYFMDLPVKRIARILAAPEGTVKRRLHYARKALAAKLGATARKPGGKAVLLALLLCGTAALGAAVVGGARRLPPTTAEATENATRDARQAETPDTSAGDCYQLPATENSQLSTSQLSTYQGELTMNATTTTRAAAMLAAATLATASASGSTLYLTAEDKSGSSSFTNWNVSATTPDGEPSSENDYVNKLGKVIRTPNSGSSATFNGKSLTLGSFSENKNGLIALCRSGNFTVTFANEGLFLEQGRIVPYGGKSQYTFAGTITAAAPKGYPFVFQVTDTTSHLANTNVLTATVKGGADTEFAFANAVSNPNGYVILVPAANTTFAGTLTLGKTTGRFVYNYPVNAEFRGTRTWPGTIHVKGDSTLRAQYASTLWTMGGLVLDEGAKLHLRVNGTSVSTLTITNSLDVASGAILEIGGAPGESDKTARQWVVMTLPQDKGEIPLENFTLSGLPAYPSALPRYQLSTNAVDGVWQLLLTKTAHDYLAVNDDIAGYSANADVPSAFTNDSSWASGAAPSAGVDYAAVKDKGGLTTWPVLRTPYQSEPWVFAGDSLTLGNGGKILPCATDVTFPLLVLSANSAYIMSLPGNGTHLRGAIQTVDGSDTYPQIIQAYMKGLNSVEAEIRGNGSIWVTGRYSSSNPYGDIEFAAANTNFTGKVKVCAVGPRETATTAPSSDDYAHERVFVTDARNLGGPLDAFRADALELADYSVLEARNDVDMNVANRGVKVSGNAGFAAPEGVTLALSNDITWNGAARKTGAGTLAIGGDPLIASGATAALTVEEGFLKVLNTNAVNGVTVSFEDGAYLLVDPEQTGDIAAYGAVDLSASPFGGSLPVAIDLADPVGNKEYNFKGIAVATVADADTANGLVRSASARKIKGHSVEFSVRANADGTATILASVGKNAFVMVIR